MGQGNVDDFRLLVADGDAARVKLEQHREEFLAASSGDVAEGMKSLSEVAQMADHVVIVSAGQLRFAGPLGEIAETNNALESAFLKLTVPLD